MFACWKPACGKHHLFNKQFSFWTFADEWMKPGSWDGAIILDMAPGSWSKKPFFRSEIGSTDQRCQIFLGETHRKGKIYSKWPQRIPNGRKIYQMTVKYTKRFHSKAFLNISKLGFWYENTFSIWQSRNRRRTRLHALTNKKSWVTYKYVLHFCRVLKLSND
jgi:hypothetical protein